MGDGAEVCLECLDRPAPQKGTVAWGEYDGVLRLAILALKYHGHDQVGALLGSKLAARISVEPWAERLTAVTAIPSHPIHRIRRGFSAADLIARSVAASLDRPYRPALRRRALRRQTGRSRAERKHLPTNVFSANAPWARGHHILVVDDVITTGTTVRHAARSLYSVGAAGVYAAASAMTPDPRRGS